MIQKGAEHCLSQLQFKRQHPNPKPTGQLKRRLNSDQGSLKLLRLDAASVLALSISAQDKHLGEMDRFDTDSNMVGMDNRCSGCTSHVRSDFPDELKKCTRPIKGFGGTRHFEVWRGTIHWKWDDDQGLQHTFIVPNSFCIPEGKVRLLSPQHWVQGRKGKDKRWGLVKQPQHSQPLCPLIGSSIPEQSGCECCGCFTSPHRLALPFLP